MDFKKRKTDIHKPGAIYKLDSVIGEIDWKKNAQDGVGHPEKKDITKSKLARNFNEGGERTTEEM